LHLTADTIEKPGSHLPAHASYQLVNKSISFVVIFTSISIGTNSVNRFVPVLYNGIYLRNLEIKKLTGILSLIFHSFDAF